MDKGEPPTPPVRIQRYLFTRIAIAIIWFASGFTAGGGFSAADQDCNAEVDRMASTLDELYEDHVSQLHAAKSLIAIYKAEAAKCNIKT